jgi:integrase
MPRVKLTAAFVQAAPIVRAGATDRTIYWDETMPSFGLMVTHNGAKSYVVQYRASGQSRRLTLDSRLTLAEARTEARKRLGDVAKGGDPLVERRQQIAEAKAAESGTLEAVAREYFKRYGRQIRTMGQRKATFERSIFPKLGKMQIGQIRRQDINRLLDHVEDTRGPQAADQCLTFLSGLFSWYAARVDDFKSPLVRAMRRVKQAERARQRVLTDDEIRAIWAATDKPWAFAALVRFLLLSAARRNEAAKMQWGELDPRDGTWAISARRYKTKTDMLLPLSKAALEVLAALPRFEGCPHVFTNDGRRPLGGFSRLKASLDKACGVVGWTLHDCRRTARTLMSRAGVPTDHAGRALGHALGGVRGVYDRHSFKREKQAALEALAKEIAAIVGK